MRISPICLLLLSCIHGLTAQPSENLPEGIRVPGRVVSSERFTDVSGENLVVITSTGIYYDQLQRHEADGYLWNNGRETSLYAFRYLLKGGVPGLKWNLEEHTLDCADDIVTEFYRDAFHSTDLDKDGVREIWLMYRKGCLAGPAAQGKHLIMFEGEMRYAIHGSTSSIAGKGPAAGGGYRFDGAFQKSPSVFRDYAAKVWAAAE